jgi:hypothetical protein
MVCNRKSGLSPARKQLVEMLQRVNFGKLENLVFRGGEPVFSPPPAIVRELKFSADPRNQGDFPRGDFELKSQILELFDFLDDEKSGVIEVLEVKHGLPFRLNLREAVC